MRGKEVGDLVFFQVDAKHSMLPENDSFAAIGFGRIIEIRATRRRKAPTEDHPWADTKEVREYVVSVDPDLPRGQDLIFGEEELFEVGYSVHEALDAIRKESDWPAVVKAEEEEENKLREAWDAKKKKAKKSEAVE